MTGYVRLDAGWFFVGTKAVLVDAVREAWLSAGLGAFEEDADGLTSGSGFASLHRPPGMVLLALFLRSDRAEQGAALIASLDGVLGEKRIPIAGARAEGVPMDRVLVQQHVGSTRFDTHLRLGAREDQ